jgi:2,3-bisphosphoglycerate-independent phosphoglycerate mutase
LKSILKVGGELLITADHGNAEKMFDEVTHQAHTAHTSDPVPLIYVGRSLKFVLADGRLSDIAPTMLFLLGLDKPGEMTGRVLLSHQL